MILLILLVKEPQRGGADGAETLRSENWFRDVREICKVFVKIESSIHVPSFSSLAKVSF